MSIFDRLILLATGLVLMVGMGLLWNQWREASHRASGSGSSKLFELAALSVFLVSGLLLIALGWEILANDLVAVVATIIPFGLAAGLVREFHPRWTVGVLLVLAVGLVLITTTRFAELRSLAKVAYPVFHSFAALIVIVLPIRAVRSGARPARFAAVSAGGLLISTGGVALAFLSAGKQLLFFSQEMVLLIFAPLLFATAVLFTVGLTCKDLSRES